jgi:hypothetical protein
MRMFITIALLLGVTGSAWAQESVPSTIVGSSGCWPVTSRDRVVVQMDGGSARTGTLLCMGPEEIMLTGSGRLPLSNIRQISRPRDSYLDGVLKGAAVGLVILAFCTPDARDARLRNDRRSDRCVAGQQQDDLSKRATRCRRLAHKVLMHFELRSQCQCVFRGAGKERRGFAVDPRIVRVGIVRRQRMTALARRHVHDAVRLAAG